MNPINLNNNITFSTKQQEAINLACRGENLFITGKAGTGKSAVIKEICNKLKLKKKNVVLLAPSGLAAANIGGQTFHSFFAMPPFGVLKEPQYVKKATREIWNSTDTIIIDEVSMMSPDWLDYVDAILQKNRCKDYKQFQYIFVGDMKQLPPVLGEAELHLIKAHYYNREIIFSSADAYHFLNVKNVELDEVFRQADMDFIDNLNLVRDGHKAPYFNQFIIKNPDDARGVLLTPTRSLAEEHNRIALQRNCNELEVFNATITGDVNQNDFLVPFELQLKEGCKIMYLKNDFELGFVNGDVGELVYKYVEKSYRDEHNDLRYYTKKIMCIRKDNGQELELTRAVFEVKKYELIKKAVFDKYGNQIPHQFEEVLELVDKGTIRQYPVMLAYALTIHKSQGMTLDKVTIDLTTPCFASGQLYVALSRVRSPEGLRIITK